MLLGACTPKQQEPTDTKLKVMAWNIWHAGHLKEYGKKGETGTLEILKNSGADVIMMIETYGAADIVADYLGYYHRLLSSNLSIYSRYPITKSITFPDSISTFNFGGVEIDVNGQPVRILDTWLHYLPDTRKAPLDSSHQTILDWETAGSRDNELRAILNCIEPYLAQADSIPVIMGGDFNSHSHLDWVESTKDTRNHGGAVVEWTISKMMTDAGFIDSFREIHPDPNANYGTTWLHPVANNTQDRIDYVYYKGAKLSCDTSETYNKDLGEMLNLYGKEYFYASDHGLVLSTFTLKK